MSFGRDCAMCWPDVTVRRMTRLVENVQGTVGTRLVGFARMAVTFNFNEHSPNFICRHFPNRFNQPTCLSQRFLMGPMPIVQVAVLVGKARLGLTCTLSPLPLEIWHRHPFFFWVKQYSGHPLFLCKIPSNYCCIHFAMMCWLR